MQNIRPIGVSDRLFYYNGSGHASTFDLQVNIDLFNELSISSLKISLERAIQLFPEFRITPVIKNNSVFCSENTNSIPVLEDNGRAKFLGTDETNGYLFCVKARDKGFNFSCFHGLSDYWGILRFVKTVMYYYAVETGINVPHDDNIRTESEYLSMDVQERFDPYSKFADPSQKIFWEYKHNGSFAVPEKVFDFNADYARVFNITCSVGALLKISREFSTSLMPLLMILTSGSLTDIYKPQKLPVLAMVPVNLRPFYNTKTLANFSDGILVQYEGKLQEFTREKQALILRARMDLQMQKENFDVQLARKVSMVNQFSNSEKSIYELNKEITRITQISEQDFNYMTYAFTYPGQLDFNPNVVKYASIMLCVRQSIPLGIFLAAFGDELSIKISQSFDNDIIAQTICEGIKSLGVPASIHDMGHIAGDKLILEKITSL